MLAKLKTENSLTIEQMAKKLGVSMSLLAKVLNGNREPSLNLIKKVKLTYPNIDTNLFF